MITNDHLSRVRVSFRLVVSSNRQVFDIFDV